MPGWLLRCIDGSLLFARVVCLVGRREKRLRTIIRWRQRNIAKGAHADRSRILSIRSIYGGVAWAIDYLKHESRVLRVVLEDGPSLSAQPSSCPINPGVERGHRAAEEQ